jgi:hypothetical protein
MSRAVADQAPEFIKMTQVGQSHKSGSAHLYRGALGFVAMRQYITCLFVLLVLTGTSCYRLHTSAYRDANVSVTCSQPMVFIFPDAHGREARWDITVDGQVYRSVRGLKPYYIKIPELDSILFVTGTTNATFHLFSLATRKETQIFGGGSPFGVWIGWDSPYPPGVSNYVAAANSDGLLLVTLNDQKRMTEYLDLKARRLEEKGLEPSK